MRTLATLWNRIRSLAFRNRVERELSEEFEFHLEHQIQENLAAGMPAKEARANALRAVGGISQLQEECRDMRRVNYIEDFLADAQYALRGFRRNPAFAALAIVTLALGIGASTALFSLVNAVMFRPLPMKDPARLAVIWETDRATRLARNTPAPANFADWKEQNKSFEDMGAASWQTFNITGDGNPERVNGLRATGSFLSVLGVKPALGRLLTPSDDQPESGHVVVISHHLWQSHYGGNSSIIGRSIQLNGESHIVVGVAPAGFQFPAKGADVWASPGLAPEEISERGSHYLVVVGRLKPSISLEQARADMAVITARLEREYPGSNKGLGVNVVPMHEYYVADLRLSLNLLLGAVGALLLIGCANLAHLFLARANTRRREIAVRAAVGAGRARVIRQLLTESTLLAFIAAALGAAISTGAFHFLTRLIPQNFPEGTAPVFDLPVMAFTTAIALITAMLFGAGPAFQASRLKLNDVLTSGKGSHSSALGRARGLLVMAEVALTVVLLVAAGLLLTSYTRIRGVNTGFRAANVLTLETALSPAKYNEPARRNEFYRQVIERTEQLPGVLSAGYVNFPPLTMKGGSQGFFIEGRVYPPNTPPPHRGNARIATAGYLRTLGIPILRGRNFDERDTANVPRVVVINQALANAYWPGNNGQEALGARLLVGPPTRRIPLTIIGIAGDVKQMGLDVPASPEMYFPVEQAPGEVNFFTPRTLLVRATGDPVPLAATLRRIVSEIDPDQPVANIRTMNEIVDSETESRETQTTILTAFAIAALLLASIGLYGVLTYTVTQRTAEIGLLMALGAQRTSVLRRFMTQSLRWTAIGATIGLAGAFLLTRTFAALLFEVSPSDPLTFAGVFLLLFAVTLVASFIPAWRAASIDPVAALKQS